MKSVALFAFVCLFMLIGCDNSGDGRRPADLLDFEGQVRFVSIEGGFWAIVANGGRTYEPTNLPDGFKEDGLAVRVIAEVRDDLSSIHMVGPIIEIITIRTL